MPIDRVTVSLATSRKHAASLQQQVSQLMQQLNPQLAALLARYLPADAMLTAPLRLDIGTLPLSQFSSQFAPRLLAALEQVLQQLEIDPTERFAVPADQGRGTADGRVVSHNPDVQDSHRDLSGDAPGASPVVEAASPEWSTLLRYLINGYWPTFATVAQPVASGAVQPDATAFKQQGQPGANAQAGSRRTSQPFSGQRDTSQPLLRQRVVDPRKSVPVAVNAQAGSRRTPQRLSGQRDRSQPLMRQRVVGQRGSAPVAVNALAGSRRTPQQLLRQRLMGQPAISPNERAVLIGALQLPGARQRLLRLMTTSDWRQLCALLAPAARLSTASPLALLLLLWQQPELPVLHGFSAAELRSPQPQEQRELERLLTADNPQPLLALQPWLAQQSQQPPAAALTAERGPQPEESQRPVNQRQGWQQRLSARAQQQLARLKPATSNASPPAPKPQPLPEQLELHHAGLVLLWPLLPGWLRSLGLVIQTEPQAPLRFSGPEAQQQAIALLDALIWQDDAGGEWRSLCSKLLCGWPLEWPLDQAWPQELARQQAQQLEPALQALLLQLPGLKNLSLPELRQLFLQRPGTLEQQRFGWQLSVQPHPADILLRHIPWPLEQIHYSWLSEPVTLNWPRPGDAFAL